MASYTSPEFLAHLKSLYPQPAGIQGTKVVLSNPWYYVAAVGFGSSNRPEAVPLVFLQALADLKAAQKTHGVEGVAAHDEQLLLVRRIREAILKGGVLCGCSRAINALIALYEVTPEELRDTKTLRDQTVTVKQYTQSGDELFRAMYAENADRVQGILDSIYPDMTRSQVADAITGWYSTVIGYGMTYGQTDVLSQVETSYILVAALIAIDTALQAGWHLANARHGGATLEEARAVRRLCIDVAEKSGINWRDPIPDVD